MTHVLRPHWQFNAIIIILQMLPSELLQKNEIFLAILQTVSAAFQTVPVTSKFG